MTGLDTDCVVIGAGFAGLTAADQLARAGWGVHLVEARERVGGRVATIQLEDGTPIDVGGQWIGPTQDRMYALCRRFGREVYPMYTEGASLLGLRGELRRYRGHIPTRVPPWTLANLGWVMLRLELLARRVPLEAPWEAPDAARLDGQTLGDWIRRNVPDARARSIVEIGVEAVFAAGSDELSLLHALFYMRSGKSFDMLTRSAGGAQQDRLTGGVGPLADALAQAMQEAGAELTLGAEVRSIRQHEHGVVVESSRGAINAARVILALPPPLAAAITYEPALSPARRELLVRTPMGAVIKCIATYDRPFWRSRGLSGQGIRDEGPMRAVFDASPKNARPAVLMGFIEGEAARALAKASTDERRRVALDTFAAFFGSEALTPQAYVDRAWTEEPFSRGCYAALFPKGVWTELGHTIRTPEGRLHWAGTETATVWNGYIEGAVRSGERAAAEVTEALR